MRAAGRVRRRRQAGEGRLAGEDLLDRRGEVLERQPVVGRVEAVLVVAPTGLDRDLIDAGPPTATGRERLARGCSSSASGALAAAAPGTADVEALALIFGLAEEIDVTIAGITVTVSRDEFAVLNTLTH